MTNEHFVKHPPERMSDGTLSQCIEYLLDGEIYEYIATGEDLLDLHRDWAFKYLELFN